MAIKEVKVQGNEIIITCELEPPKLSASGKTMVVCSTGGFQKIGNSDRKLNLTIIQPR